MDVTLERILSLIPKKPDGKYVHGAKKDFAQSLGLENGNLIVDWEKGRTNSYKNYLYEISAKYNVSVEWLKGETDKKRPTQKGEPLSADEFKDLIRGKPVSELKAMMAVLIEEIAKE